MTLPRARSSARLLHLFLHSEASGGLVLMGAAALALIVANSPAADTYFGVLGTYVGGLSVLHWINDALMAAFFLLVGLEIKREMLGGQLSSWSQRALPGIAAVGGIIVPALVYLAFNTGPGGATRGWAIPAATDIAFALGVLSLLGSRVPTSLKVFLTALAIIDDLAAVLIIAFFYSGSLNLLALGGAALVLVALIALNRLGVSRLLPYLALGVVLWVFVFQSGVHATLAGVLLALCIPARIPGAAEDEDAPLIRLEHLLHPWVAFAVIPIFGFANAGLSLAGTSFADLGEPIALGAALGLFVGKQVGIFSFAWIAIRAGLAKLPAHASWTQLYGTSLLCGIGFTMSLFIGLLAFADSPVLQDETKLGVLLGSLLSAIAGAVVLALSGSKAKAPAAT
jgi:NhaA family Na+:H+ antiporter